MLLKWIFCKKNFSILAIWSKIYWSSLIWIFQAVVLSFYWMFLQMISKRKWRFWILRFWCKKIQPIVLWLCPKFEGNTEINNRKTIKNYMYIKYRLSANLKYTYKLAHCLLFLLFVGSIWVTYLFYLTFTFYLQYF